MSRPKEKPVVYNFDDPAVRDRWTAKVDGARGPHRMLMSPVKQQRSLNQNALYWVAWVEPLAVYLFEQDEDLADMEEARDAAHDTLKRECIGVIRHTNPKTGEVIERAKSSRKLAKDEFSRFLDVAALWLARYVGIVVQDTRPATRQLAEASR